jgi:hypothetical protein
MYLTLTDLHFGGSWLVSQSSNMMSLVKAVRGIRRLTFAYRDAYRASATETGPYANA